MKRFLIILFAITCQISFSQTKKKSIPPPPKRQILTPPKINSPYSSSKPKNNVVSIVKDNSFPLSFKFEINKDTIFLPNSEFAEIIEISDSGYSEDLNVTIISRTASDTLKFEYNDGTKEDRIMHSYFEKRKWCEVNMNKEIMSAVDKESKEKIDFKVVLDKTKKKILYVENRATKRKYLPTSYEAPSPSIGF